MTVPEIPFPVSIPEAYPRIENEIHFDPAKHLALEKPTFAVTLEEFGYDGQTSRAAPTDMAMAGPFRVLSDEGVAALKTSARAFRTINIGTESDPKAAYIKPRGPAYSSQFIRDLCACKQVTEHFSEIAGVQLIGHPMPTLRATLVYAPEDIKKPVRGGIWIRWVLRVSLRCMTRTFSMAGVFSISPGPGPRWRSTVNARRRS